jgi:D-3-phosphoglycerate dehydrogenase
MSENQRLSLAKSQIRVLLLEGIDESAVKWFADSGYHNVTLFPTALDAEHLEQALRGVHMVGIRSRTQLTEPVLTAADRLMAIGCFCIGTNQVDLLAARKLGIPVFNAPFSNTRSVAELVIGEIVMLMRGIVGRSNAAHDGRWDKSAEGAHEVRGKTVGIIGYGNIGSQLSVLAEAMGMRVIYYDVLDKLPHGNARPVATLSALLSEADVVTLHVPQTAATGNMIGHAELAAMKPGSYLLNNARGTVVDIDAAAASLRSGHLAGAAIDVFPVEPAGNQDPFRSPLQGLPNVILTPHVGGSTAEAQARIGVEVARKLVEHSDIGSTIGAVNFPQVALPARPVGCRFMHVHRNLPGMLGRINTVFASRSLNIAAQYLQTEGDLGYVVVEADDTSIDGEAILAELKSIDGTVRARLIYEDL